MGNNNLAPRIFSDKPTKDDQLNFRDYAKILADISLTSETPATIGIFGEWGSGKSSLMMMMDEILIGENACTIWFNAWKYDKEDALWRSLILRIVESLDAKDSEIEEIRRKLYTAISTEELGKAQINWLEVGKTITKEGIKAAATVAFPLAGVGTIIANLGKSVLNTNSIDEISKAVSRQTIQRNQDRISSIEQFDKLYLELVNKLLGNKKRLIVFIDDLDRCTPLQSLLVLEALKAFLGAERCVYVVACDPRLIQKGFEKKYGSSTTQDFTDFLEKIIQLYFEMPPLRVEDIKVFLTGLGLGDEAGDIAHIILAGLDSNPRKLKRFLNNLEIQYQLVLSRKLEIEKTKLIKLACITYGWKQIWIKTQENPSLLTELQKFAVRPELENETGISPILKDILEKESRLGDFLTQVPYFSETDLDNYIFLAKATRADIPNTESTKHSKAEKIPNPFIVGTPVRQSDMFFGRDSLRDRLVKMIKSGQINVISLYGQRRMGKTSFLMQVEQVLHRENIISVYIDLQGYFGFGESADGFLFLLAERINAKIKSEISEDKIYEFTGKNKEDRTMDFIEFGQYLSAVFKTFPEKKVVLMIDEFEVMFMKKNNASHWQTDVFRFMRALVQEYSQSFYLLFCGLYKLSELESSFPDQITSSLAGTAQVFKLSYLSEETSRDLIEKPLKGQVDFSEETLHYIYKKTGGHPYLLQTVGYSIANYVNETSRRSIFSADVDLILTRASSNFEFLFHGLLEMLEARSLLDTFKVLLEEMDNYEIKKETVERMILNQQKGTKLHEKLVKLRDLDYLNLLDNGNYRIAIPLFADFAKENSV